MFALENISQGFGVQTELKDPQKHSLLVITVVVLVTITALAIFFSQAQAAGFAASEQVVHYTAYTTAIPIIVLATLTGLSQILKAFRQAKSPPLITPNITSQLPGLCTLKVKVGDEVQVGDPLYTIEVMKMEISVQAEQAGTISKIFIQDNSIIQAQQGILHISSS